MKKAVFALIVILLASALPVGVSQPWITVFEGKVKIGETLILGDYQVRVTQEKGTLKPYAIIYKGENIKDVAELKDIIEADEVRIIPGSFNEETKEVFIVLQYEPGLSKEVTPERGLSFEVGDYSVRVIDSSNESVSLSINGAKIEVKENSSRIYDRLAFVYNDGILRVYHAGVQVKLEGKKDYEIYYPFEGLKVEAGARVQIPVSVMNNGNGDLNLPLKIISKPLGWDVKLLEGGIWVSEIRLKAGGSANLLLQINIPMGAKGKNSVSFAIGDEVGKITLDVIEKQGLEVKTPLLGIEAEAGNSVSFPIELTNNGDEKSIELEIKEKPPNWDAYFSLDGQRIRSFLLEKSGQITLVVKTPRNAELGSHLIKVAINNETYSFSIFIYKTHKGEPAKLTLEVKDEEGKPVKGAKIYAGNKTAVTDSYGKAEIEVKAGKHEIGVKKEGYEESKEEVQVEDGEEKSVEVRLYRLPYYFTAEGEGDTIGVTTGSTGTYTLTVRNLGKEDDVYSFSVLGLPAEWSYEFYYTQSPIKSVKIASGESRDVALRIVPAFNAQPGEYNATIIVKSSSGMEKRISLAVKLMGEYRFEMYPETPMVGIKAGKEGVAYVSLENTGTAPITNIKFEASAPQGWEVKIVPQTIPELRSSYAGVKGGVRVISSSGQNRLTVNIKVPKTTPAGTYQITITGKGDQAQASTQITVRVTQSSKSAYLGIIILVVAFGFVIWLMRRVGRR